MNILAVGAHPDDIEYGCGGYLARMAKEGHAVLAAVGTHGEQGGSHRGAEQTEANMVLGITSINFGWLDTRVPDDVGAVNVIESTLRAWDAHLVLVNTPDDTHHDHRAIAQATLAAARRIPRVLCYHAPSSTRVFTRVVCADITDAIHTKCRALDAHASQSRHRLSELARAEALFWGGRVGVRYAEAFEPVRWII